MHFEILQSISLNGNVDRPNDDRCGATSHLAWVVDGATDMGPPGLLGSQGGAAWLASAASVAFASARATDIAATCDGVFQEIEAHFNSQKTRAPSAPWEVPKAAFSAVQLQGDHIGIAYAADCPILKVSQDLEGSVTWCTGVPDTGAEAADAMALGPGTGAAPTLSEAALADRRAHRARDSHVALSTSASATKAVTTYATMPVSSGDELILMSDGFASLVTDYRAYTAETLVDAIRTKGLAEVARQIREIERADAACLRFPRFKVSDDATALWLRVAG